jgi:hypothetical protein
MLFTNGRLNIVLMYIMEHFELDFTEWFKKKLFERLIDLEYVVF